MVPNKTLKKSHMYINVMHAGAWSSNSLDVTVTEVGC